MCIAHAGHCAVGCGSGPRFVRRTTMAKSPGHSCTTRRARPVYRSRHFRRPFVAVVGSLFALSGLTSFGPVAPVLAAGTVSLTSIGSPSVETFDTLSSTTASSVVPTGWDFSESSTNANTTYAVGTGSGTAGDTYSFGAASTTERAFGGLLSGSLTPTIGASFTNDTGTTITTLDIEYVGEQWRLELWVRAARRRADRTASTSSTALTRRHSRPGHGRTSTGSTSPAQFRAPRSGSSTATRTLTAPPSARR